MPSIQPAKVSKTRVSDPDVSAALDEIRAAIPDVSFLRGARLIENIQLTAGTTSQIPHGLGRQLKGYLIVRMDSNSAAQYIYDLQGTSPDTHKYLYLRAEGNGPKVSLLVF